VSHDGKFDHQKFPSRTFRHFDGGLLAAQIGPDGVVYLIVKIALNVDQINSEMRELAPYERVSFGSPNLPFAISGRVSDFLRYASEAEREVTL